MKQGFTAALTVSADGNIHRPMLVAKEGMRKDLEKCIEEEKMTKKIPLICKKNIWMDKDCMLTYIDHLYTFTNGRPSVLILDQYSSHKNGEVRDKAESLNITLVFVPSGQTSVLQPLDVSVNGAIKAIARSEWLNLTHANDRIVKPSDSLRMLLSSLKQLSKNAIQSGFDAAFSTDFI